MPWILLLGLACGMIDASKVSYHQMSDHQQLSQQGSQRNHSHLHTTEFQSLLSDVVTIMDSQAEESGLYFELNRELSSFFNVIALGGAGTCLTRTGGACAGSPGPSALSEAQTKCSGKKVILWAGVNDVKVANGGGAGYTGYLQGFINGIRQACPGTEIVVIQPPLRGGPPPPGYEPEWPAASEAAMNAALDQGCSWAHGEADVLAVCNTNRFFALSDFRPPAGRAAHFGSSASGRAAFKDAIIAAAKEKLL
eukprot:CAMPEP_0197645126 /NCGR_PEP_ID=MMETSP1338-20131121/17882_1 /TAXON_ID=43686 ORGANISM="Pelagodinium beii, Strain RCC1491" /NCGR_SAMPLE_ID=MMETSP1338 /ASSEMBLY_ACC=CAM_ASM_000754 /LENGTH=251 /DNA_ID=CAMNT_0043218625 /DNA_START=99 /DNA_END=854 /DNA_ORIENTATION=+